MACQLNVTDEPGRRSGTALNTSRSPTGNRPSAQPLGGSQVQCTQRGWAQVGQHRMAFSLAPLSRRGTQNHHPRSRPDGGAIMAGLTNLS